MMMEQFKKSSWNNLYRYILEYYSVVYSKTTNNFLLNTQDYSYLNFRTNM